tara:strand:- start:390 stop:587 length:198 start_codon:yes stop_codon:yes gene_type:complete
MTIEKVKLTKLTRKEVMKILNKIIDNYFKYKFKRLYRKFVKKFKYFINKFKTLKNCTSGGGLTYE